MVPNKLRPKAKVAIIIDQPSDQDNVSHKLMTDEVMAHMAGYLASAGIIVSQCSMLSVVQEKHPNLRKLHDAELMCWTELLRRDLNAIKPNMIITIGEIATQVVTGKKKHELYRGSVLPSLLSDCKTLVLWNPCHASNPKTPWITAYKGRAEWKPFTSWDCQKAARHRDTADYLSINPEIIVTKDMNLIRQEFLSYDYVNDPASKLACDIEASYCEMTCIGFAKENKKAYVIPLVHMEGMELAEALDVIDKVLQSKVRKSFQNGNFDVTYMGYYYGIKVMNFHWDTMLAMHSMFPNLPKGLGILGSIFTEEPYWKDESKDGEDQKTWLLPYHKVNWPRFFIYNGKDTANLITIWEEQEDLMEARGTRSTFDREMRICKPLITMELQGVKVNPKIQAIMAAKLDVKIEAWELFLEHLLGEDNINVGSYQQLRNLLYDKMKLPVRTKKNKVTSDGDALLSLIRFDSVVLKSIIILKDLKKQRQFTKIKYNLDDTRVRTTFKPGGTATGRLSSSQSITKTGTNLQQQPKWAREFYVPDNGMILVQADYSKAESWIVAALAKDAKMIEALLGPDFHSTNAGNLLGRPVTKADYDDRQLGKKVSHGTNYGMTEFLLHKVLIKAGFNFTKQEVSALMQAYHDAYPGIRTNYHNWIKDCLQRDMTLETPFGRKVTFYDFWGTRLFNKAYAWIPQSTIGDMTNTALCQVYENMGHYCDLLIQVHDSLALQVKPENFTQGFVDDLAGNMIVPLEVKGTKFSVPIDVEAGLDWYHLHDWDDLKAEREQFGNTAQFAMAVNNINNRKALKKATKEHAAEELTDDFMGEDLFAA